VWLTGEQKHKSGMAGESFRAGQDQQSVVVPIIIIIIIIINHWALVRQRTIPTERPPLVGEVRANFSG
jgi:hypothetical protein